MGYVWRDLLISKGCDGNVPVEAATFDGKSLGEVGPQHRLGDAPICVEIALGKSTLVLGDNGDCGFPPRFIANALAISDGDEADDHTGNQNQDDGRRDNVPDPGSTSHWKRVYVFYTPGDHDLRGPHRCRPRESSRRLTVDRSQTGDVDPESFSCIAESCVADNEHRVPTVGELGPRHVDGLVTVKAPDDLAGWMEEAGMVDVEVLDLTDLMRPVWERRLATRPAATALLLGSGPWSLGRGIRYIRVRGTKPT